MKEEESLEELSTLEESNAKTLERTSISPDKRVDPPKIQWWCGNCKQGPMSNTYNSACLYCHRSKIIPLFGCNL